MKSSQTWVVEVVAVVVMCGGAVPVECRFLKTNITVVYPDESTAREVLDVDERGFSILGVTRDEVAAGFARADGEGKIQEVVVGDKHIPVQFHNQQDFSFSFVTVNDTYWTVSSSNFTNITVDDFEDDETLKPVEVQLDWSFPRAGSPHPMTVTLTAASSHQRYMVQMQDNKSNGTWQQLKQGEVMSLRVVNPHTQQTTLSTFFDADLVELELLETLRKLREGRVALLMAHSAPSNFLGESVRKSLSSMGSLLAQHLMPQGTWAWAWIVNGATLAEGLVANVMGVPYGRRPPPLHLEATLPPLSQIEQPLCRQWPESWVKRQQFCELYDGYDDLCSCTAPFIVPSPLNVTKPEAWHEELGVVIMASSRPRYLYRLLQQLMSQPGVVVDQILVSVDGPEYLEAIHLADLLGLNYQIHQPEGRYSPRISRHLRFALFRALKLLSVDKLIVLEEDLILAPDFIMYMQQTSVLLDEDPSLYGVSAFSHFSFKHTARDLTRLHRVHSFPAYGWMVKRSFLNETLPKWPPVYVAVDWDYWMGTGIVRMGREVVVPEVSRTAHSGVTGSHVQGSKAKDTFLRRALSNDSDARLNVSVMKKKEYEEEIKKLLASAAPLNITHLFSFSFPREGGVFAVCVKMLSLYDNAAFRLLAQYLGVWYHDARESHLGLWRLPYYHSLILILGVPYSKYSRGYLQEECPVLRATPSMAAFLDYDFLPTNEKWFMPEDYHDILELPLDAEQNETNFYSDDYDYLAPSSTWQNEAPESTLLPVDVNEDSSNFTEASTIEKEENLTSYYTASPSLQDKNNNYTTPFSDKSASLITEDSHTSSSVTTTSIPENKTERNVTTNSETLDKNLKTNEHISVGSEDVTNIAKNPM